MPDVTSFDRTGHTGSTIVKKSVCVCDMQNTLHTASDHRGAQTVYFIVRLLGKRFVRVAGIQLPEALW